MDAISTGPTCDRCRTAAAHWRYTKTGADQPLEFCDHHDRQYILRLNADGWTRQSLALPSLPDVGAGSFAGG